MTPDQASRALEALAQAWPLFLLSPLPFLAMKWLERGKR